jgi:hypothetical protein
MTIVGDIPTLDSLLGADVIARLPIPVSTAGSLKLANLSLQVVVDQGGLGAAVRAAQPDGGAAVERGADRHRGIILAFAKGRWR